LNNTHKSINNIYYYYYYYYYNYNTTMRITPTTI